MIRLIASDLDGTLLDSQRRLPKDFFSVIDQLNQIGVRFIAASGRSYPTLRRDFAPHSDELCFISDNGARIAEHGKLLQKDPIPPQVVKMTLDACAALPDVEPVLTSDQGTYANTKNQPWFHDCILAYFDGYQQTDDLYSIHEDFYKISLCDRAGAVKNSFRRMPQSLRDNADLQVSGFIWLDVMKKGVNKGRALKAFQKRFGVTKDETMVFGDFYNDSQMLLEAKYSFVMENANDDMKPFGNYIAPSNDDDGVMRMIKKYVLAQSK